MNEDERAKRLSEAIDALLQGGELNLEDEELMELLRIARLRHRAGQALADLGLAYQELLRRVLQARIVARQMEQGEKEAEDPPPEAGTVTGEDPRQFLDPLDPDYGKLVNFLDFWPRPSSADVAAQTTLAHPGPAVTPEARPRPAEVTPLWPGRAKGSPNKVEALSAALDGLLSGRKRTVSTGDVDVDELVRVAQLRRFVGQSLAAAGSPYKRRLWTILRLRVAAQLRRRAYAPKRLPLVTTVGRRSWRYAAAAAAVIALLIAALGPLPATGLADHPIAHFIDLVGRHVGVEEVEGPPPTQVPIRFDGETIKPVDAQSRLGLPVREPSYIPQGFQLARSSYYPQSFTTPEQGMFVLMYTLGGADPTALTDADPQLRIYQERATPGDVLWVQSGQAEDMLVGGSVPGTYLSGIWANGAGGGLEWDADNAESLLFNNGDVRTFIVYTNGDEAKGELLRVAESMLTQ